MPGTTPVPTLGTYCPAELPYLPNGDQGPSAGCHCSSRKEFLQALCRQTDWDQHSPGTLLTLPSSLPGLCPRLLIQHCLKHTTANRLQERRILPNSPTSSLLPLIPLPTCSTLLPFFIAVPGRSLFSTGAQAGCQALPGPCPSQLLRRCRPLPDPRLPQPLSAERAPTAARRWSSPGQSCHGRPSVSKESLGGLTRPQMARPHLPGGRGTCRPGHGNSWKEREGVGVRVRGSAPNRWLQLPGPRPRPRHPRARCRAAGAVLPPRGHTDPRPREPRPPAPLPPGALATPDLLPRCPGPPREPWHPPTPCPAAPAPPGALAPPEHLPCCAAPPREPRPRSHSLAPQGRRLLHVVLHPGRQSTMG